jgi:hypothetical protein
LGSGYRGGSDAARFGIRLHDDEAWSHDGQEKQGVLPPALGLSGFFVIFHEVAIAFLARTRAWNAHDAIENHSQ